MTEQSKRFYWGASTAAHQVEGQIDNDWTRWEEDAAKSLADQADERFGSDAPDRAHEPATYRVGEACDHYERYEEDFDIAADLNHNAHRFSIEWARVMPERENFDEDEIDHYRNVVSALQERDIEPFVTLWHFTNPKWFADGGGWLDPDFDAFEQYVRRMAEELHEDVDWWLTINEPHTHASHAHLLGERPPENRNPWKYYKVRANLAEAHNRAYDAIKDVDPDAMVGLAIEQSHFAPVGGGLLDRVTSRAANWWVNYFEMDRLDDRLDYIGLNYYFYRPVDIGLSGALSYGDSIEDRRHPPSIYDVIHRAHDRYDVPIVVTENGMADSEDEHRGWYIRRIVRQIRRAMDDGADVRGYLHWTLLDNYEWDSGTIPRMGLVEVDFDTLEREVRGSAREYAALIEQGIEDIPPAEPDESPKPPSGG